MKRAFALFLFLAACNSLPAGQGDGGVTGAESDQLNEAAEILDSRNGVPMESEVEANQAAEK